MKKPYSREFAIAATLAAGIGAVSCTSKKETEQPSTHHERQEFTLQNEDPYLQNPNFFQRQPNGEYNKSEKRERKRKLSNGEKVLTDVGLEFYHVKSGDTIDGIRAKLGKYPEYEHVLDERRKIKSFNIPERELKSGMWLPIPIKESERIIDEGNFVIYAKRAIEEMKSDPEYGDDVARILRKITEDELIATLMAVAKQEAGGEPIGQFALHRWEPHHNRFSFSHFHILMKDAGLSARRKLDMTEGQTIHPQNSCKLFIAFMAEKSNGRSEDFFPLDEHFEEFASFYNGRAWKRTNPHYVTKLKKYYGEAKRIIAEGQKQTTVERPTVKKVITPVTRIETGTKKPEYVSSAIGNRTVHDTVKNISTTAVESNIISTPLDETQIKEIEKKITTYIEKMYPKESKPLPTDRLTFRTNEAGSFVLFTRGGKDGLIRIPEERQDTHIERKQKKEVSDEKLITRPIGNKSTRSVIKDINHIYTKKHKHHLLESNSDIAEAEKKLQKYMTAIYGNTTTRGSDELSIGENRTGVFLRFRRGDRDDMIRVK